MYCTVFSLAIPHVMLLFSSFTFNVIIIKNDNNKNKNTFKQNGNLIIVLSNA